MISAHSSVVSTVQALLADRPLDPRSQVIAQVAMTLAARLDDAEPREAAALAKQLTETIERLVPPEPESDVPAWMESDDE